MKALKSTWFSITVFKWTDFDFWLQIHKGYKATVSGRRMLVSTDRNLCVCLPPPVPLASRHKGMRQVGRTTWTCCSRPTSSTELWIILEGWLAGAWQECLGIMVGLERATANDYGIGGQLVDRKMFIHERGCKGGSMNLWTVILTATWPSWWIYKIYFKRGLLLSTEAHSLWGKKDHSFFYKRESWLVFTIFKKV